MSRFARIRSLARLPVLLVAAAACQSASAPSDQPGPDDVRTVQIQVSSNADSLGLRLTDMGGQEIGIDRSGVPITSQPQNDVTNLGVAFLFRAAVAPPTVTGVSLEASHVALDGSYAYVSYMIHGEATVGAVDVFDISRPGSPRLVSSAALPGTEIAAITVRNGFVYLAGATDDPAFPERAVLAEITLSNKLLTGKMRMVGVPSYFATGVAVLGSRLYVTSGSGGPNSGGLTVLDAASLKRVSGGEAFLDARDVSASGATFIAALQGGPAKLRLYSQSTGALAKVVALPGGGIPDSKSSVVARDHWAFAATGDGGTQLVDMAAGTIAAALPRPTRTGVDPADAVTNAVSLSDDVVLTANGGAGVQVAWSNYRLNPLGTRPFLMALGRLDMPGSANFIASNSSSMFVANGTGGLQIVQIVLR